jgi:hypothetical protein
MPTELLRVDRDITWLRTIHRRRQIGIETEFVFNTPQGHLSIAIDRMPSFEFLVNVTNLDSLSIEDRTLAERGWLEHNRHRIVINIHDEPWTAFEGLVIRYGYRNVVSVELESREELLTSFWIVVPGRPLGFGVTAWSLSDAVTIIRSMGFGIPIWSRITLLRTADRCRFEGCGIRSSRLGCPDKGSICGDELHEPLRIRRTLIRNG